MSKLPWILLLLGVGGTALVWRSRQTGNGLGSTLQAAASHPLTVGLGAGVANGLFAAVRRKPVSLTANLVTASVIGISEGMLSDTPKTAIPIAGFSALGATLGMAAFTRWDREKRALVEAKATPAPTLAR